MLILFCFISLKFFKIKKEASTFRGALKMMARTYVLQYLHTADEADDEVDRDQIRLRMQALTKDGLWTHGPKDAEVRDCFSSLQWILISFIQGKAMPFAHPVLHCINAFFFGNE